MRKRHVKSMAAVAILGLTGALLIPGTPAYAAAAAQLRTDQVGYLPSDTKIAYLMAATALSGEAYKVINASGATVAHGTVTTISRGSWNSVYPHVYPIDLSSVTAAGTYHVTVSGTESVSSDTFKIESAPRSTPRWSATPSTSSRTSATARNRSPPRPSAAPPRT